MYTMLILSLLLVSACLGAPPVGRDTLVHTEDTHVYTEDTHVHTEDTHVHTEDDCTKSYCRVSNDTLDSALETFLCMKDDDIKGLREKDKKRVLAQKIAPLLKMNEDRSSVEDILAKMDTARLVPIVNLVLHDHDGDAAVEPKTELEYTRDLRERLSFATSLQPSSFRRTSPIVLGFLNCQAKLLSKLHDLALGGQRDGRSSDCSCNGYLDNKGEGECNADWPYDSKQFWCYVKEGSCSDAEEWEGNFWSYEACDVGKAVAGSGTFNQFAMEGLKSHNDRRSVGLTLDADLCDDAQAYADQLAANDNGMIHASAELRQKGQGENLAWNGPWMWSDGTAEAQNINAEEPVFSWYDEMNTGEHCMGHYTQVVWKGSKKFCMAKAMSKSKATYTVARYYPAGNMEGDYADNVPNAYALPCGLY